MRLEIEAKKEKQVQMQQDIANAQSEAVKFKGKLANQKTNVVLKAKALSNLTALVEVQQD